MFKGVSHSFHPAVNIKFIKNLLNVVSDAIDAKDVAFQDTLIRLKLVRYTY